MLDQRVETALWHLIDGPGRPVVLIDGGAGSGKSTLAATLVNQWPGAVQLVSMDEFYPGWDGLAAAAAALPELIRASGFRSWDWSSGTPGAWRSLDPDLGLIVEGCGALTRESKPLAGLAIWLESPAATRRERALARDGALFAPHWQRWAEQEAEHWRLDRPQELADLVLRT